MFAPVERGGHSSLVHVVLRRCEENGLLEGQVPLLVPRFRVPLLLDQPQERLWKRYRDGDILRYGRWSGRAGDN